MFVIDKKEHSIHSLPAHELKKESVKAVSSELAQKILSLLAKEPLYPIDIAKKLKIHEQKVYYHIRNLEQAGVIKVLKKETKQGAVANYYTLVQPAYILRFKDLEESSGIADIKEESDYLQPFIKKGQLNALIVVGSPDPHGPEKARSRDGYYGMDLALFLGTFLNYVPQSSVKLDTEVRDDELDQNLILIGGPIVNRITGKINNKLPVRFEEGSITSTVTKETYPQDECGMIVKTKNPLHREKKCFSCCRKTVFRNTSSYHCVFETF